MLVVLFLPVLLLCLGLVADFGLLLVARSMALNAADMAALAGVQDLDMGELAAGCRVLVEEDAKRDARLWLEENITPVAGALGPGRGVELVVKVYNATQEAPMRDGHTSRLLEDPTVCVLVRMPVRLRFLSFFVKQVTVTAHADASAVQKGK